LVSVRLDGVILKSSSGRRTITTAAEYATAID
jgi:hypothetical protein